MKKSLVRSSKILRLIRKDCVLAFMISLSKTEAISFYKMSHVHLQHVKEQTRLYYQNDIESLHFVEKKRHENILTVVKGLKSFYV